jgi:[acyl-carrier-protein] S-malonyltransferase
MRFNIYRIFKRSSDIAACLILADNADDIDMAAQRRDITHNIAGTAQSRGLALRMQNRDGRFGRDAIDLPIDIAVEHQIPHAQNAAVDKLVKARGDIGHGRIPERKLPIIDPLDISLTSALIGLFYIVLGRFDMTRALVFPGQGSQAVGMGQALAAAFTEAREVFEEVDAALSQNLSKLMFEGSGDDLKLTENAQPALMAVSMAVIRVLDKQGNFRLPQAAKFVAGHSLGEYSALCAAGSFTLADTARLLKKRGLAMQQAVPVGIGTMAALIGVDLPVAQDIATAASQGEVCTAANDNAPGQVVISGHVAAVDRAIVIAAERGFKRSVKLPVSAPFHCSLMQPAADVMRSALADVEINNPIVPLIANVTAQAVGDAATIRDLLVEQVTGSVRWRESVLYMKEQGVSQLVECGTGAVLAGMTKRIDKEITALSLSSPAEIEAFLKAL